MKWYKTDIKYTNEPFIEKVKAGGRDICLVGYEGEIFALANECPHMGYDLSLGLCAKGKLVCPYHRFSYNLVTGKGDEGQNDSLKTYSVNIEDGDIYVGMGSIFDNLKKVFK